MQEREYWLRSLEPIIANYFVDEIYRWKSALLSLGIDLTFFLYILSSAVLGVYAVFYISSFVDFLKNGSPKPHNILDKMSKNGYPRVGVIVPVYNDYEILSSLKAIMKLDYPNLKVIVADDSSDENLSLELSNASQRSGGKIIHLKRKDRSGLKAGALNKAIEVLIEMYNVDYVLILDADFEPHPRMVHELVELALSEDADLVQGYQRHSKGSDTLFGLLYRASMAGSIVNIVGRSWSGLFPFFTGSCGLISKRVLKTVRFREGSLSEDLRLSIDAMTAIPNLKILATHEVYADGSIPRNQKTFWKQQIRWSVGTLDEFFRTYRRVLSSEHISSTAKLGYMLQGLFFTNGLWVYLNTLLSILLVLLGYGEVGLIWPIGVYLWLIGIESLTVAGATVEKYGYLYSLVTAGYMFAMIYYTSLIHSVGTLKFLLTRKATWYVTSKRGRYERLYKD